MATVAGIQMACGTDREENLGRALDFARIAVERGAKILCFAECFA
jgi:predicted amidohydrolase